MAVALLPAVASVPSAQAATNVVPTGSGLTEPAGVAVTPDGAIWVSDAVNGLCRVSDTPDDEGNRLVRDAAGYCAPHVEPAEGQAAPRPLRPTATFQIAFDAEGCEVSPATTDPAKCNFYVAEGTSARSGVWRMHWNPVTRTIDSAVQLYSALGDNRVFGIAVSPEGHVDFSSKRDNIIRRLRDAGTTNSFAAPEAVGFSAVDGVPSLAHLGQALILADGTGVSRIDAPGPQGGLATAVGTLPAGVVVSAVATNPAEGVIFAGTSSGRLTDSVLAATLADGLADDPYDSGFANVTALGVRPDGTLLIAHDPMAALEPGVDTIGFAELFAKPAGSLRAPRVTLTATPQPAQRSGAPADTTFRFISRAGATFSCLLDREVVDCGADADGRGEFVPAADLDEGNHAFEVLAATAADGSGPSVTWHFTIDRTAPEVTIDEPTSRTAVGGALRVHFSSNESSVGYECKLDDGDFVPCNPARDLAGLAMGEHTFTVAAIDAAGNRSEPASWTFTAVPAPPAPKGPAPAPAGGGSAAPRAATPVAVTRAPRLEIGVPCIEVSPARQQAAFSLSGRSARVRFRAPTRARFAKFTLRRADIRRSAARLVETLGYATVRSARTRHVAGVALTAGQRRAIREGRMALAVAYGTCRTRVGEWQWMQTTNQEGSQR